MLIHFQHEPSGAPDRKIRVPEAEQLAKQLIQLLISGSQEVIEFSTLCETGSAYQRYDRVFRTLIRSSRRRPDVSGFFQAVYSEYQEYASLTLQTVWVKAMGYIVEHAFFLLMRYKYPDPELMLLSEHKAHVPPPPCEATTENYPIDVIVWCNKKCCGEFLEVKKNLDTKRRDSDFSKKVSVMYQFASDLASHSNYQSLIGVATLSTSPLAEMIVRSALVGSGAIPDNEDMLTINPRFHIISMDNLKLWYQNKVI